MLFASVCVICRRPGAALCQRCAAGLEPAPRSPPPRGFDWFASLLAYDGLGRQLVLNLKYRNTRAVVSVVAPGLAELARLAPVGADVVTWAPTTRSRRRQRGFDQARLLAVGVARQLGLPCTRLLDRLPSAPQTGGSLEDRRDRPQFRAAGAIPPCVLVVDDVHTSGSTLAGGAAALHARGAERLIGVTLALTP